MPLPEHIRDQIRWLAENLDNPEAEAAAMALADEVQDFTTAEPGKFRSRATLEHEFQALVKYAWNLATAGYAFSERGDLIDTMIRLAGRRPPPFVVSVDDSDCLRPEDRFAAQEALLAALVTLGFNIRGMATTRRPTADRWDQRITPSFHSSYIALQITPPAEFWQHYFDRGGRCIRCHGSMLHLRSSRQMVCPGQPPTPTTTPVRSDE